MTIEQRVEQSRLRLLLRREPVVTRCADGIPYQMPEDTAQIPRLRYRTAACIGLLLLAAGLAVAAYAVIR